MRFFAPRVLAVALASLAGFAMADTVTLKTGEKVEGKIISDDASGVKLEVTVSAGVSDERAFTREEIADVRKDSPADLAYLQIQRLGPQPMSMSAAAYDDALQSLNDFLVKFPADKHKAEVKKTINILEEEKSRVEVGDFKLNGYWIPREQVEKRRYQIEAQLALNTMKDYAARGDLMGAMNAFDRLEKGFPGALIYPDAIELARRIVDVLLQDVDRYTRNIKRDAEFTKKGIELASEPEKTELKTAAAREQERYDEIMANAELSEQKWKPLIPRSEKALKALKAMLMPESKRLNNLKMAAMRDSIRHTARARDALKGGAIATAEMEAKESVKLWALNEDAVSLQKDIIEAKITPTPAPTPTPTPKGAKPAATPAPGVSPAASPGASPAASPGASPIASVAPSVAASASPAISPAVSIPAPQPLGQPVLSTPVIMGPAATGSPEPSVSPSATSSVSPAIK